MKVEMVTVLPVTTIFDGDHWVVNMTTPHDLRPQFLSKRPEIGDQWAYLPTPEGMP